VLAQQGEAEVVECPAHRVDRGENRRAGVLPTQIVEAFAQRVDLLGYHVVDAGTRSHLGKLAGMAVGVHPPIVAR
jgi:hypothetical protein